MNGKTIINTLILNEGVYSLRVKSQKSSVTKKIVIVR
ncbi:MAG: hypothetical protein ACXVNQ_06535 [Bacteroidia bacterium]